MSKIIALPAGLAAVAVLAFAAPAAAQQKLTSCRVGQRVMMPGGYPGTVTKTYGQGGCTVKDDARGLESSWAAFMLTAAPGSAPNRPQPIPATPAPGAYQCFGGTAGNMKLSFGPGSTYANEQGKRGAYVLRPGGQIAFISGPWAGFFGKTMEGGRVGLTSRANSGFYQMTCDRR